MTNGELHRVELAMNLIGGIVEAIGSDKTTETAWLLETLSGVRSILESATISGK